MQASHARTDQNHEITCSGIPGFSVLQTSRRNTFLVHSPCLSDHPDLPTTEYTDRCRGTIETATHSRSADLLALSHRRTLLLLLYGLSCAASITTPVWECLAVARNIYGPIRDNAVVLFPSFENLSWPPIRTPPRIATHSLAIIDLEPPLTRVRPSTLRTAHAKECTTCQAACGAPNYSSYSRALCADSEL